MCFCRNQQLEASKTHPEEVDRSQPSDRQQDVLAAHHQSAACSFASGDQSSFGLAPSRSNKTSSRDLLWACIQIARRCSPSELHRHRRAHGRGCETRQFAALPLPLRVSAPQGRNWRLELSPTWRLELPRLGRHAQSGGYVNERSLLAGAPLLRGVNWSSEPGYRRWSIWISVRMRQSLNLRIVAHQTHSRVVGARGSAPRHATGRILVDRIDSGDMTIAGTSTSTGQMTAV